MDTNQLHGFTIIVLGIITALLMAFLGPQEQIVASGAVGCMIVFGAMLASGNWPYAPKRRRRRRIGESRMEYYLKPIKEFIFAFSRRLYR